MMFRRLISWWRNRNNKPLTFAMFKNGCRCVRGNDSIAINADRNLGTFHSGYGNADFIYYYIKNRTPDLPNKLQIAVIARAISILNSHLDIHIHRLSEEPISNSGYVDGVHGLGELVRIEFVKGSEMVNPGALAEARRGRIFVNDDWNWGEDPATVERYLTYVILHEFGHVGRYLHSSVGQCSECVMNPFYRDVHPVLQEYELHDMYLDYGMNPKWKNESYRKRKEKLWSRNLTEWWDDFKLRNR